MDKLKEFLEKYCEEKISDEDIAKSVFVDTKIYAHEWDFQILKDIEKLAPF